MASGEAPKQNKTMLFAILGGAAIIAVGLFAAIAFTRGPSTDATKTGPAGSASVATAEGTSTAAVATADPNAAATAAATGASDNTPPPPGTGNNSTKAVVNGAKPSGGSTGAVAKADHGSAPTPPPAAAPEQPKAPAQPKDLSAALGEAVGKKPDAPSAGGGGGSTAPFDRGAAAAALGGVNVQSCKKGDGPTGAGHVTVTFSPDGSVQSAVIDSGPFPGTPVGGCIAGKYRGAHVPAFGGAAVRVGKSFTLN
jgi:hypothetical protein